MSDAFGYGQVGLDDGAADLNAVARVVRTIVARMSTMKLVKVMAVHPGSGSPPAPGTVDVLLLVNQIDGNGFPVKHGTVYGLPVWRLQGGQWSIICDPAVGDYGYVVCADRDSSLVVKNPGQANPGSRRRYDVADGVYVGGLLNPVPAATAWFKSDGTLQITDSKGNVLSTSSSGFALTGNVAVTGNITATGDITAGQGGADSVTVQNHTHPGGSIGSGTSGPPTPGT